MYSNKLCHFFLASEDESSTGLGLGGLVSFADSKSDPYLNDKDDEDADASVAKATAENYDYKRDNCKQEKI